MHNMMTMIDNDGLQRRRLLNEKVRKFIKPNSISAAFHSRCLNPIFFFLEYPLQNNCSHVQHWTNGGKWRKYCDLNLTNTFDDISNIKKIFVH